MTMMFCPPFCHLTFVTCHLQKYKQQSGDSLYPTLRTIHYVILVLGKTKLIGTPLSTQAITKYNFKRLKSEPLRIVRID